MSLDMGVSYAAAVNQLVALKKISRELAEDLPKQPKSIKTLIAGVPIENSWADIWALDKSNSGKRINMRVYDELRINLSETPSTGYIWTVEDSSIADMTRQTANDNLSSTQGSQHSLLGIQMQP